MIDWTKIPTLEEVRDYVDNKLESSVIKDMYWTNDHFLMSEDTLSDDWQIAARIHGVFVEFTQRRKELNAS